MSEKLVEIVTQVDGETKFLCAIPLPRIPNINEKMFLNGDHIGDESMWFRVSDVAWHQADPIVEVEPMNDLNDEWFLYRCDCTDRQSPDPADLRICADCGNYLPEEALPKDFMRTCPEFWEWSYTDKCIVPVSAQGLIDTIVGIVWHNLDEKQKPTPTRMLDLFETRLRQMVEAGKIGYRTSFAITATLKENNEYRPYEFWAETPDGPKAIEARAILRAF